MEPIGEDVEEEPSSSCCACLFGSSSSSSDKKQETNNEIIHDDGNGGETTRDVVTPSSDEQGAKSSRPGLTTKRWMKSVYMSAKETLTEEELNALKEFEEAAMELVGGPERDESVYFDALEATAMEEDMATTTTISNNNNSSSVLKYAPATMAVKANFRESCKMEDPSTLLLANVMKELHDPRVKVNMAGYPGALTEAEVSACMKFRAQLQERAKNDDAYYQEMVQVYSPVETEPYALCRFLRARQFDVERVFEMMEGCRDVWGEARKHDFFPDPNEALGAPMNVFMTQFSNLYSGCAKNGAPINYFRTEGLSVEGVECLVELDMISNFAWHTTVHRFKKEVARAQEQNPDMVRCEALQVMDLKALAASTLNARTMETLKKLIRVNNCFPEILNCMVILNAPRFFSFFWKVIKTMLDPRTASKIEVFSNEKEGIDWLQERVAKSELLSDYGGTAQSFDQAMVGSTSGGAKRQVTKLFAITSYSKVVFGFILNDGETVDVTVYTRSPYGADFAITKNGTNAGNSAVKPPQSSGTTGDGTPSPYYETIFSNIEGPGKFQLTPKGKSGMSVTDYFVVSGQINQSA